MQKRVLTLQIGSLLQARFPALNEEQLRRALAHATFASYKKGESLVEAGDIQTQLPILFQGVFRGYALDPEGGTSPIAFSSGGAASSWAAARWAGLPPSALKRPPPPSV